MGKKDTFRHRHRELPIQDEALSGLPRAEDDAGTHSQGPQRGRHRPGAQGAPPEGRPGPGALETRTRRRRRPRPPPRRRRKQRRSRWRHVRACVRPSVRACVRASRPTRPQHPSCESLNGILGRPSAQIGSVEEVVIVRRLAAAARSSRHNENDGNDDRLEAAALGQLGAAWRFNSSKAAAGAATWNRLCRAAGSDGSGGSEPSCEQRT